MSQYTLNCRHFNHSTISRTVHSVAQTRELACTKIVLPQVIDRGKCLKIEYGNVN